MDFVYHHKPQISKELWNGCVFVQKHGLQRFRGDLQNTGGFPHQSGFVTLGHISMPMPYRNIRLLTQICESCELVIDQSLQRTDINASHRGGRVFREKCNDREEGRFCFTGGSRGCQQNIVICIKDGICCGHLNGPEILPMIAVDIVLNKRGITVKGTHRLPLTIQILQNPYGCSLPGQRSAHR